MFEEMTYEELLKEKLSMVDDKLDKREGSIIYDTLAPNSAESSRLYANMDLFIDRVFADTAKGEDLERKVIERGIRRKEAVYAVFRGKFYNDGGEPFDISIGDRFQGGVFNFYADEKIENGIYKLKCETAGSLPNGFSGRIIPVEYIEGLTRAEIDEILVYGEEKEDDESLRKRYFSTFKINSFGGNIDDYKSTVNSIEAVGACKIYPVYYGGGTVRIVILNNGMDIPDENVVKEVQAYIDPIPKGMGYGTAPIGHDVYVEAAGVKAVNISGTIIVEENANKSEIYEKASEAVRQYFNELIEKWEDNENIIIRISRIEMKLLDVEGVVDMENICINGQKKNLVIESDCIPRLGTAVFE